MTWDYSYLAFATFLIQQECKDDNVNIEWKSPRNNADGFQDRYDEAVKTAENIGKDIEKYKNIVEEGADYVAEKFAWEAAGYDWYQKELNSVADGLNPDDKMEVDQVTKIINYYDIETYEERRNYYEEVSNIIK